MSTDVNIASQTDAATKLVTAPSTRDSKVNGTQPAAQVPDIITTMTIDTLRDFAQSAGYRVETVSDGNVTFLRSATNGLPFDIRPGNVLARGAGGFVDVAFVALFAVRGTLPLDLVNRWNRSHRFGRLFLDTAAPGQEFLVFSLDVSFAGGVTSTQLRGQIDIWDGLIQQLIPWLREEVSKVSPMVDTSSGNGTAQTAGASDLASDEKSANA